MFIDNYQLINNNYSFQWVRTENKETLELVIFQSVYTIFGTSCVYIYISIYLILFIIISMQK